MQAHGNGIEIRPPWDNLYQECKMRLPPSRANQNTTTARLACLFTRFPLERLFAILKSFFSFASRPPPVLLGFTKDFHVFLSNCEKNCIPKLLSAQF